MHVCMLHTLRAGICPRNKIQRSCLPLEITMTMRDSVHLICTIITYEMNKAVQLSILLLFENASLPPDSSSLLICDVVGQPERRPY